MIVENLVIFEYKKAVFQDNLQSSMHCLTLIIPDKISQTLQGKQSLSSVAHVWYYEWYGQECLDSLLKRIQRFISQIFLEEASCTAPAYIFVANYNKQSHIFRRIYPLWMSFYNNFRYVWSSLKGTLNTVMSQETFTSVIHVKSCKQNFSVLHESVQSIFRWL